ncbi:hypothetical protein [Streptomyces microflavus]|uniref:hypothetical protein n=1 Tax=Streptomyces microflavus TaxID=1919 RepID=UPI003699B6F2
MTFNQPGQGGDTFDLKTNGQAWMGSLMLVWPISIKPEFDSGKFEPTDVVVCDIALLDRIDPNTGKPLFFKNAFLFSKPLVANTRNFLGGMVLGRLTQKQFAQGVGWTLDDFTPQDEQVANQYIATNPREQVSQPSSAQSSPPQQDPWAGVNASPTPPPAVGQQSWGASAPQATGAASGQQQGWGGAAPAAAPTGAASPPAQQWGAPPPPPPPPSNGVENWQQGLADFLRSKGVDPAGIPNEDAAVQIAKSL